MMKREMVKAAIGHQESGRIPFCIHLAADAFELYGKQLFERYASLSIRKLLERGLINLDEGIRLGIGNFVFALGCPWWTWYNVPDSYRFNQDAPDFLPKTIGVGSFEGMLERIKLIKELTGSYILVHIYGSHFEKAYFSRGIENFLADMASNPQFAKGLLNKIIEKNMVMLENIVAVQEIDGILLGSDWGSQKSLLMSPGIWKEMIAPGEKREYDLVKSENKDVWIHSCGNIEAILPDLVEMGVDVLNPLQPECMDIYKIKALYGDKMSFWGGISTQQTLPYGTPADVVRETRKVAEYMSKGGGYILAPAQDIQADVPFNNICALIETANEYV